MPVQVERATPGSGGRLAPAARPNDSVGEALDLVLVNNMPDAALESTERQFMVLLESAAGRLPVRLRLACIPQVPRSDAAREYIADHYCDIAQLLDARVDGIIVTGTEPRAASLAHEPYWRAFTGVVDWAEARGVPSVWSCLAAHAAVLHKDGIPRRPLQNKRFGLFDCLRVADHPLAAGMPGRISIAHSRWNELVPQDLWAAGYTVLTHSPEAGVDSFVLERNSLCVFFQGHPEYDHGALLREYRRDVGRYLRSERETYPAMPVGYFDATAAALLTAFRARAMVERSEDLLAHFPTGSLSRAAAPMRASPATPIYANWLAHAWSERARRLQRLSPAVARTRPWDAGAPADPVR